MKERYMPEFFGEPVAVEAYIKPEFSFYQQEFDGTQPEMSREEANFVGGVFAASIDAAIARARGNPSRTVEFDDNARLFEDGESVEYVFLEAPDGREVLVEIQRDKTRAIISRRATIFWTQEYTAQTQYSAFYKDGLFVYREDTTGRIAPGASSPEQGLLDKFDAEELQRELGFNFQPIGIKEVQGLHGYLTQCT